MRIEHDTWVAVADGGRALVTRNIGDADFIRLELVEAAEQDNPASRAQGTDRPGRMPDWRAGPAGQAPHRAPRSALETTDWHRQTEEGFARMLGQRLLALADEGRFQRLVLVADPRTMSILRHVAGAGLAPVLLGEVTRDLTGMPLPRIAEVLAEA